MPIKRRPIPRFGTRFFAFSTALSHAFLAMVTSGTASSRCIAQSEAVFQVGKCRHITVVLSLKKMLMCSPSSLFLP